MNRDHTNQPRGSRSLTAVVAKSVHDQPAQAGRETSIADDRPRTGMIGGTVAGDGGDGPVRPTAQRGVVGPPFFRTARCRLWFCGLLGLGLLFGSQFQFDGAIHVAENVCRQFADQDALIFQDGESTCAWARFVAARRSENQGVGASSLSQVLQNREGCQLGQTQKWLKRYKTGMLANLAMFANEFAKNQPATTVTLARRCAL